MKPILIAIGVATCLVAATAFSQGGNSVLVTRAIVAGPPAPESAANPTHPQPGYIAYNDYDVAVPAPGCYWTRLPIHDAEHKIVGWRGRPVAVCPQSPQLTQRSSD
jgi:hypothetical protein